MRQFFKFITASCLGTLMALGICIGCIMIYLSVSGSQSGKLDKKSVLRMELKDYIPERSGNIPEDQFSLTTSDNIGLSDLIKLIKKASEDPMIEGIVINTYSVSGGQATIYDLRNVLKEFKTSGKFLYAYSDFYSQSAYWLSSIADSIWLNPNGYLDLKGYGVAVPFYKELLDKVGIEMNVFYAGTFKSATEPYRRTNMSDASKQQTKEFLNDMQEVMMADISASRSLSQEKLKSIITEYQGGRSATALSTGLVDILAYWTDFETVIKNNLNIKETSKVTYVSVDDYAQYLKSDYDGSIKNKIAVIYAEGEILYGNKGKGVINDEKYLKIFDQISRDDSYRGVVFRINSPGGNSLVSDNIAHAVKALKAKNIPIIASYGDYAASGGYYISAFADTIVAAPNTLTGSIGVYVMFPNARKMLNEHLGVYFDTLKTDPFAVSFTPYFDLNQSEKTHMQAYTDELYQQFISIVASGRNLSVDEVDEVAQGRVWTGLKAKSLGLVDEIGNLQDAIKITAESAGIDQYNIIEFPKIKANPWKKLIESIAPEQASVKSSMPIEVHLLKGYHHFKSFLRDADPQARLPYIFYWN